MLVPHMQIKAKKGLSLQQLLGKELPDHGVTLRDYIVYSDDKAVDNLTDSTLFLGEHVSFYLAHSL